MHIRCRGNDFADPFSSNGSRIFVYLAAVAWQRLYTLQYQFQEMLLTASGQLVPSSVLKSGFHASTAVEVQYS
jgi:hypothetical protein